jgi:hypothetical protein
VIIRFWDGKLWTHNRADAERQLAEPGAELRIYVSPANPAKSIVHPTFYFRHVDLLIKVFVIGLVVAGVGIWVAKVMCPGGGP